MNRTVYAATCFAIVNYFDCRTGNRSRFTIADLRIVDLNYWRKKLYRAGLSGQYDNGIGFGNISQRFPGLLTADPHRYLVWSKARKLYNQGSYLLMQRLEVKVLYNSDNGKEIILGMVNPGPSRWA